MNETIRYMIAGLAVFATLTSCSKEHGCGTPAEGLPGGVRVISVQFDNSTKAAINGFTPKFENGDKIRVSDGTRSEEREVSVNNSGDATFTTTFITGNLVAIYPSEAALLGQTGNNPPIISPDFKVSATQDGTIKKALIARAQIVGGDLSATFYVRTALFEITPPSEATSLTITSLNTIETSTGQRSITANAVAINTTGANDAEKRAITVTGLDTDGKAYVALVPGVNLTDLSFEYTSDDTHGAMKGIPASKVSTSSNNVTKENYKYTIDNQNWHEYVTIGGLKWATRNIGATEDTGTDSYGTYFSWGSVAEVYSLSGSTLTFQSDNPDTDRYTGTWTPGSGFDNCNTPYYNGSSYSKYTSSGAVLELADDAAYVNWGGPWRMPTKTEFDGLKNLKRGDFSSGRYFGTSDTDRIFLPATGYIYQKGSNFVGTYGHYWSSSNDSSNDQASQLIFDATSSSTKGNSRCSGRSIRPVADCDCDNFKFESYIDKGSF